MAVTEQEAIQCVRRAIDQIELDLATSGAPDLGMDTNADVCTWAQSLFSNDDIKLRFLSALRYVLARVGSIHAPGLETPVTVGLEETWPDFYRVIEETVGTLEGGTTFCQAIRKSYRTAHDAEQAGRCGSDQHPVYAYEDADLTVLKSNPSTSPSVASVQAVPLDITDCPESLLDAVVARTVLLLVLSYPDAEDVALRWKITQRIFSNAVEPLNLFRRPQQKESNEG